MKNNCVKRAVSKLLVKAGTTAAVDANMKTCPMFSYQPKQPKALKKSSDK